MKKIGIIGAMELEVDTLKKSMDITRKVSRANMEFCEGTLGGAEVVVVRSGIGKVNAALCVQILVDPIERLVDQRVRERRNDEDHRHTRITEDAPKLIHESG